MAYETDDQIEVTNENFGDMLIQGLREARAVARGEAEPDRRIRRLRTVREATVTPPQKYGGAGVQKIREKMGLSQNVFARVLNASPETVKAWEQNKRQPDGMALALLEVAERHPEALLDRVKNKAQGHTAKRTGRKAR